MNKIKTKTINQSVVINASPGEVYDALMDSKKHSQFTGEEAKISNKVKGKFTAYGGYIEGESLKLTPGKIIVQSWRGSDWPKGHFSKVTYTLMKKGNKTQLKFKQEGVPVDQYDSIKQGWVGYYWKPLSKMFGEK